MPLGKQEVLPFQGTLFPAASQKQADSQGYDPNGNVEWLAQEIPGLGRKYVRYEYDLISGKVLRVSYQENTPEQFHHRYGYDEDNRLTQVETSADGTVWERDAAYAYHRHGPLRTTGLGHDRVQAVDYTYTIHGWLKAINGGTAPPAPGGGAGAVAPADAFRMALSYYRGDYKRTGAGGVEPVLDMAPAAGRDLFNGNIAAWSRQVAPRPGGAGGLAFDGQVTGEQFTYDELNRLRTSTFRSLTGPAAAAGAYATAYGYDPNGNLLTLTRNDRQGRAIDNLTYRYNRDAGGGLADNKLKGVADASRNALGVVDQPLENNYEFDETGNLIADAQDRIKIEWTVYGKVKTVAKTDSSQTIRYLYDASGNRTVKTVRAKNLTTNAVTTTSTYYVRDAQGNVLAVYDDNNGTGTVRQSEVYLYGSSRLGVFRPAGSRSLATNGIHTRRLGQKEYELTDHLGNVRAVVGDHRQAEGGGIRAALRSYFNHYAFGLEMPGMVWKGGNSYRYGYNGQEKDGETDTYAFEYRMHDPKTGRFWSVDPLDRSYPYNSPYAFAENRVIDGKDLEGRQWDYAVGSDRSYTQIKVNVLTKTDVEANVRLTPEQMKPYYKAISDQFNRTFLISTGGKISGKITFDQKGISTNPAIIVPTLEFTKGLYINFSDGKVYAGGETYREYSRVNLYNKAGGLRHPDEVAIDAVHELFHTIRLAHPFDETQAEDTKLIETGSIGKKNGFITTATTDKYKVYHNIMSYSDRNIDGKTYDRSSLQYLTVGQIGFIIKEIQVQKDHVQTQKKFSKPRSFEDYWDEMKRPTGRPVVDKRGIDLDR